MADVCLFHWWRHRPHLLRREAHNWLGLRRWRRLMTSGEKKKVTKFLRIIIAKYYLALAKIRVQNVNDWAYSQLTSFRPKWCHGINNQWNSCCTCIIYLQFLLLLQQLSARRAFRASIGQRLKRWCGATKRTYLIKHPISYFESPDLTGKSELISRWSIRINF